jgi:hypothetical protein
VREKHRRRQQADDEAGSHLPSAASTSVPPPRALLFAAQYHNLLKQCNRRQNSTSSYVNPEAAGGRFAFCLFYPFGGRGQGPSGPASSFAGVAHTHLFGCVPLNPFPLPSPEEESPTPRDAIRMRETWLSGWRDRQGRGHKRGEDEPGACQHITVF